MCTPARLLLLLMWSSPLVLFGQVEGAQLSVRHDACGSGTGMLTVTWDDGVPPYTVAWSTGLVSSGDTLELTITDLFAGMYSVTVTDASGIPVTVEMEVLDMPTLQYPIGNTTVTTCDGTCTSRTWMLPAGEPSGASPYTVAVVPAPATGSVSGNGQYVVVGDLCPGQTYTATLSDANGCALAWEIAVGTSSTPQLIEQTIVPSCADGHTGEMTLLYDIPVGLDITPWQGGPAPTVAYGPPELVTVTGLGPGGYTSHAYNAEYFLCYDTLHHDVPGTAIDCAIVQGQVYADLNGDCDLDGGDVPLPYRMVDIQPAPQPAFTDAQGQYVKGVPYGTHTVDHAIGGFATICPDDLPTTVVLDAVNNTATVDLALAPLLGPDVGVHLWASPHKPGYTAQYMVHVVNTGPHPQSGVVVELTYDPVLTELLVDPPAQLSQPGGIQWAIPALAPFGSVLCSLYVEVPADPDLLGTTMTATAMLTAPLPDADPANDMDDVALVVTGAYDPNDKQARTSSNFDPDHYFPATDVHVDYTVRFQNTGSAPAEHVFVLDTISTAFDLMSFQLLGASHAFTASLLEDRTMRFDFPGIMLPDSAADPLGSQGFVRYRIVPKDPVADQVLSNAADIFFDFNPPVRTNTSELLVALPTAIGALPQAGLRIRPNPARDMVTVHGLRPGPHRVDVLGTDGRWLLGATGRGPEIVVPIASLAPGTYLLRTMDDAGAAWTHRLVVAP
ncbi:MAG: hypothetical protein RBT71_04100 [Flavobacteriales bacterium]|jgi:uncharacterized repeat protein (TIGR01451 family)|nr:hypothetical protein [Flavobacteriales bacterium]